MTIPTLATDVEIKHPINIANKHFIENKWAHYAWLRENAPVYKGKLSVLNAYFLTRYDDCVNVLKDPRFLRNRGTATGKGGRLPFPLPKSMRALTESMILMDDPEHRRLRNLVHKAFTPRALRKLEDRIESLTHELLDKMEKKTGPIDLIKEYAHPIPVTVIAEMVGVDPAEVPEFVSYVNALSSGFSGLKMVRTMAFDIPKAAKFARGLIERKRQAPGDDILTGLIQAEEEGETLTEEELVAMLFLIIIGGHETTVYLISNGVVTLLEHPDDLDRLRREPELMGSAVEELLRYNGPIHGTKPEYPSEDVTLHGVTIPKGSTVMPLLGAANFDPAAFENPEAFDITRSPNRHLAFGQGAHYCLGAPLARIETNIALNNLIKRYPDLRLAVKPEELKLQTLPGWHRFDKVPLYL